MEQLKPEKEKEKETTSAPLRFRGKRFVVVSQWVIAGVFLVLLIMSPFVMDFSGPEVKNPDCIGETRIKGPQAIDMSKPNLLVYRKINEQAELLKEGVTANPGDLLQLGYTVPENAYGVILSVDGNGTVTLHFPADPGQSSLLEMNQKIFLDSSYELDDAPGFERFFFITSSQAIDVKAVLKGARELVRDRKRARNGKIRWQKPGASAVASQTSILIVKGDRS